MSQAAGADLTSVWLEQAAPAMRLAKVTRFLAVLTEIATNGRVVPPPVPDPVAAVGAASALREDAAKHFQDLARCWDWIAASTGYQPAVKGMIAHLVAEMQENPPRLSVEDTVNLIGTWHTRVRDETRDVIPMPAAPPQKPLGGLVVVPKIGDPLSNTGVEINNRYKDLIGATLMARKIALPPSEIARLFRERFPWALGLADTVETHLHLLVATDAPIQRLPEMLLVGSPGCGKTTMVRWLAETCGFAFRKFALGGTADSGGLSASSRHWSTQTPCGPLVFMAQQRTSNPVIALDEIDKSVLDMGAQNGSAMGAAVSMLQSPEVGGYYDTCLMSEVDLSGVTWMATANGLKNLPRALIDRFSVHVVPSPGPEHFDAIYPGVLEGWSVKLGVSPDRLPWLDRSEIDSLRRVFIESGCSMRSLERAWGDTAGAAVRDRRVH